MKKRELFLAIVVFIVSMGLMACSGSGGGGAPPVTSKPVLSSGIMAKGSVIVNGVRFEDTAANITGDDAVKTTADLKDGMVVKVKGRRNDDGVTGTAERIEIENEVRGLVTSVGTGTFGVLGQTVIVSSATVTDGGWTYDPLSGLISGLTGTVEVHGTRNSTGAILASRVEMINAPGIVDELRGIVTGLTPTPFVAGTSTFSIGGLTISTSVSTTVLPAGATVQEGTLVEVHLSGTLATRIEVEDAEDAEFEPAEGQEVEFEGFVTNYDGTDFDIGGTHVHTTGSTEYEDGIYADLANDVKVEVEGHMSAGILVADKVKFKDTIRIEANITATSPLTVLGLTVYTTAGTEIIGGPLAVSDGVKLRGYLNSDGSTITATRIEKQGSVAADKNILQGPVSAKSGGVSKATTTLTIAGITISLVGVPDAEIKDDSDTIISLSTFYASITLNRTAVKVRGTMGSPFLADKAEIE